MYLSFLNIVIPFPEEWRFMLIGPPYNRLGTLSRPDDETLPCILGHLFSGVGVVLNNIKQNTVHPAVAPEIHSFTLSGFLQFIASKANHISIGSCHTGSPLCISEGVTENISRRRSNLAGQTEKALRSMSTADLGRQGCIFIDS